MSGKPEESGSGSGSISPVISSTFIQHHRMVITPKGQKIRVFTCTKCRGLVPEQQLLIHAANNCQNMVQVTLPVQVQSQGEGQSEFLRILPGVTSPVNPSPNPSVGPGPGQSSAPAPTPVPPTPPNPSPKPGPISCPSLSPTPEISDTTEVELDDSTPTEPQNYDDLSFVCLKCGQSFSKTCGVDNESHWNSCKDLPFPEVEPEETEIPDYSFFEFFYDKDGKLSVFI